MSKPPPPNSHTLDAPRRPTGEHVTEALDYMDLTPTPSPSQKPPRKPPQISSDEVPYPAAEELDDRAASKN